MCTHVLCVCMYMHVYLYVYVCICENIPKVKSKLCNVSNILIMSIYVTENCNSFIKITM